MIRREIKSFTMDCDGVKGYPVTAPFTLYSALNDLGRVRSVERGLGECNVEALKFYTTMDADESCFNGRYTYLRLSGVEVPCEVYLNKVRLGVVDSEKRTHLLSTDGVLQMGENLIELEFTHPDWNAGLSHSIEFLKFNNAIIDEIKVTEKREDGAVSLEVELETVGSMEHVRAVATLISGTGQIYYGGFNKGKASITVRDPLYWWPGTLGVHNIYKLNVNLYGDMEIEDTKEIRIGLRTLVTSKNADGSLLEANGVPFVPMGAVFVPEKTYIPDEKRRRTAAFVTSAAMAGFNALLIRAGSRIPDDDFFDLCDVHGIVVICEFTNMDETAVDTVARLSYHPSFAPIDIIGCSDNIENIAERLAKVAPRVEFSLLDEAPGYVGEISIPVDKTTCAVIGEGERNPFSDVMENYSGGRCREMAAKVASRYLFPYNSSDFAYLTRLYQAERCKEEILSRRMAFGASGRAIFSSISADSLICDSSLDHRVRWKALHYYASKFFSDVALSLDVSGTDVSFSITNARKSAVYGTLEYRIIDSSNLVIYKNTEEVEVSEHSSKHLFTRSFEEHIASHENDRYIEYVFTEGTGLLAKGASLFTRESSFKLKAPNIKADIFGSEKRFSITLSADAFAKGVELDFGDIDVVLSDNYFDITSPAPIKVSCTVSGTPETAQRLTEALKIRSLYDVGR
ncbi:MAG: hypothetical protein IJX92_06975 [Clostridia bacterium]|nr:hypothetical protein [Clostridia bacterium]